MPLTLDERPTLSEADQITEYISSYRASSDRVRKLLYASIVASLLIVMPTWNIRQDGWPVYWLAEWTSLEVEQKQEEQKHNDEHATAAMTSVDAERLARLLQQRPYAEEFLKRALFVHIPLLGVTIDINDVAVIGGLALNLLMLLLFFSAVRQHENLYLCTFKLRRLCESDTKHSYGDSAANFLYHALAMSQVLLLPPTLARSGRRWVPRLQRIIVTLVYFVPAALYAYIVWGDHESYILNAVTGMPGDHWRALMIMLGLLVGFTVAARYYSRLVEERFDGAFRMINPHIAAQPPHSWVSWFHLRDFFRKPASQKDLCLRIGRRTYDDNGSGTRIQDVPDQIQKDNIVCVARHVRNKTVGRFARSEVGVALVRVARRNAEHWCARHDFQYLGLEPGPIVIDDVISGSQWRVTLNWPFRYGKHNRCHTAPEVLVPGATNA